MFKMRRVDLDDDRNLSDSKLSIIWDNSSNLFDLVPDHSHSLFKKFGFMQSSKWRQPPSKSILKNNSPAGM